MIKLKSFEIKSQFKNLNNLTVDFEKCNGVTVLIGNNGSGKSNIIEALSSVFAGLYDNNFNPSFSYILKYEKNDAPISIEYNHTKSRNKYSYSLSNTDDYLPSQIISIYSGEELRLWNRYYFKFYNDFMKDVISSKKSFTDIQRMVFINKYYWNIALLTMLVSDLELSDILGEKKIHKIEFEFTSNNTKNITNYEKHKSNEVLGFVKDILRITTSIEGTNKKTISLEDFKFEVLYTHRELFKLLSISLLPKEEDWKLINKLELFFEDGYSTDELSEGEKKQILIKFITRIFADDNALLLMDEPDSHIHISNKENIKKLLYDLENKVHVQSVITTHSPTLTHCFENDNVFMLVNKNGKIALEDKTKLEIINNLTGDFWNLQEQNIFNSSQKPIILLVEGKHDKIHITNAWKEFKDEYPDLDFEVFDMSGADNIPHIMIGLRTSKVNYEKLFIGIFDDDKEGRNQLNKTTCKFPGGDKRNYKLGYYAFKYEKFPEYNSENFTVENMFDSHHFEKAYKEVLEQYDFNGKSIDSAAEEIKDKAKNILADNSATFNKDDFKHFKSLFDKIREIKNNFEEIREPIPEVVENEVTETVVEQEQTLSINPEQNHKDYTNTETWTIYEELKSKIQSEIKGVAFNSTKDYIGLKQKKNIAFFKFRKKFFSVVILAKKETIDKIIVNNEIKVLSESVQKFWNGECSEIIIKNNNHLDEIVELLKIASK